MLIGLRIDVDTFRGTKLGVPNLCQFLEKCGIKASFFFSVGPDNMGRHLWQMKNPKFFLKMMKTKASNLYGWDILFKGTLWQGPVIGERLSHIIRYASDASHEIGLHAWDHHAWQIHLDKMNNNDIQWHLNKGFQLLTRILGYAPTCSAVPAWKCNDIVLMEKSKFHFDYNSDSRGENVFLPVVNGKELPQPQIPVTLPTYDEVLGYKGILDSNYNDYMISLLKPDNLNVLTIHAEVEGITKISIFEDFVRMAQSKGASFVPLGVILKNFPPIKKAAIVARSIPGREGWCCFSE